MITALCRVCRSRLDPVLDDDAHPGCQTDVYTDAVAVRHAITLLIAELGVRPLTDERTAP